MLMYEVKIICTVTKEVFFSSLEKQPILPSPDVFKQNPGMLVITTLDAVVAQARKDEVKSVNKKSA